MNPIISQRTASILKWTCLFVFPYFIFLSMTDGCKSDSEPTAPDAIPFPTVAQNWSGAAFEADGRERFAIDSARFSQVQDTLTGRWDWHIYGENRHSRIVFTGTITLSKEITLRELYREPNSTARGDLGLFTAKMNAKGDSISGTTNLIYVTTFLLVKQ